MSSKRKMERVSHTVPIKAISVNKSYLGRKVKSKEYRVYEEELLTLLPDTIKVAAKGSLQLLILFGHSNPNFDWDNGIKPFQDILQKKYGFNDKRIQYGVVGKVLVKKGEEFIMFRLEKLGVNVEEVLYDLYNA